MWSSTHKESLYSFSKTDICSIICTSTTILTFRTMFFGQVNSISVQDWLKFHACSDIGVKYLMCWKNKTDACGPHTRSTEEKKCYIRPSFGHIPAIIWAYPRHHFQTSLGHIPAIILAYPRHRLGIFRTSLRHIPAIIWVYPLHHLSIFRPSIWYIYILSLNHIWRCRRST